MNWRLVKGGGSCLFSGRIRAQCATDHSQMFRGGTRLSGNRGRHVKWRARHWRAPPGSRAGPESTSASKGRAFRQDRLLIGPKREPGLRGDVMSELPGRPNLDQLRRQARELLRAATGGEPDALARLRAVSERVTLSAAQLAVAREYGFPSWPALRAEAERRRRLSESRASVDPLVDRWSFGGATPIETTAGALSAGLLIIGPGHAALDASLMPEQIQRLPAAPPRPGESTRETRPTFSRAARRLGQELLRAVRVKAAAAAADTATALAQSVIGDVTVTDDRGTRYGLDLEGMS